MEEYILKRIYESLEKGLKVAMVVLTETKGSTPRKEGSVMTVWEDGGILGSIGGGTIEHKVREMSIDCLKKGEDRSFYFKLNESGDIGMKCGGEAKGYIKVFYPPKKLVIVGGGHIGQQLYKLGKMLGYYTVILDDREEYASRSIFADAEEIIHGDIEEKLLQYPVDENSYIIIASRNYEGDLKALRSSLGRKAAYIGMIGSARKTELIMRTLMEEGICINELDNIFAPVGLDISSNRPEEIAFGIISEILLIKNRGSLRHRKDI